MAKVSYATARKIKILQERFGPEWRKQFPGRSVDSVYNEVMGDRRKNLFCKISPSTKSQLDEMVDTYDVRMSELVERLINAEYRKFEESRLKANLELAAEFTQR